MTHAVPTRRSSYLSVNNADLDDQNSYEQRGGRVALLWEPTPQLSVKLAGIWQSLDSDGNGLYAADLDGNRLGDGRSFNNYVPESYDFDLDYYSATIDRKSTRLNSSH